MHRSNWGQKSGQERILAIRLHRSGWEKALSLGVLTSLEKEVYKSAEEWSKAFTNAQVRAEEADATKDRLQS